LNGWVRIFCTSAIEPERGYGWVHQLKKKLRKNIPQLLALSRACDPFYFGSPTQVKKAEWFAAMWEREYEGQTGIHLRRVHYYLDALQFLKLEGMPYRNVKRDWRYLMSCSQAARLLGLVPADAFDDHRNAAPHDLHWRRGFRVEPTIYAEPQTSWNLPSHGLGFSSLGWKIAAPKVAGYDPDDNLDRAYYLELWIEKTTMDDILVPLARRLGIRLVTSAGYQSITNAVKLLQRVRDMARPTRIFYISDYDKAGNGMPIAVARQIEFQLPIYAPGANVKLLPIALTAEQIAEYKLPYSGIEKKGTVELDALEALVPGELAKIVRQAVQPYLDGTIDDRLEAAESEANRIVGDEWARLMRPHEEKLRALQKRVKAVADKYQQQADDLNERMQRDLEEFKEPLALLEADVEAARSGFAPDLPDRPTPANSDHDESDWLYDSAREYLHQLPFYKAQRQGATRPTQPTR
jgi:hypothetical protein